MPRQKFDNSQTPPKESNLFASDSIMLFDEKESFLKKNKEIKAFNLRHHNCHRQRMTPSSAKG